MDVDSNNDTAETIAGIINSHMTNLTAQTAATINKHATQTNASLQQLATNTTQLHHQQQAMMNQMAMMTMNNGAQAGAVQQTFAPPPTQIYQTAALPQYQQGYGNTLQQFGVCGRLGGRGGGP
jgi:oligoribonuclease (3'-5' exoribonuclease)